jgi:NAD(P)-dependent dehydrogenase (short-subunit alcohol dehydrogenase family)
MIGYALLGLGLGTALGVGARRHRRASLRGRIALVTGGSRGLGLELARELGRRGARVAICARDPETLERAQEDLERRGISVVALAADVGEPTTATALVQRVVARFGGLDILVNNAGIITVGPLATLTRADFEDAMRTNFWGAVSTTLAALPFLRASGDGRVVNIVSIGGKMAVPHLLPYSASKFALAGFSEGLAAEVRSGGVQVTTVYPGLMRTGSPRNALFKGRHRAEYAWFSIADAMPGLAMDVRRAARRIVDACARGELTVILTLPARLAVAVHAALPGVTIRLLALANRLLPGAAGGTGRAVRGRDSESVWSPSMLTRPGERAARSQNQA